MHFRHKKREHDHPEQAEAAAQKPQETEGEAPRRMVCRFHGSDVDVQLSCRMERIEETAVPEVATGVIEQCDDLEGDACSICYETAVPEIHIPSSMLQCPAVKSSGDD